MLITVTAISDTNLLIHIIKKCGAKIPYNDIASDFGTTPAALRSKIDRIKRKYKNSADNSTDDDEAASDEDAADTTVASKKRKRTVEAGGSSQHEKKVKVEDRDGEQGLGNEESS